VNGRHGGFSMVELMIATTLALLVTGSVISMFVGSRTAYQATSGVASLTDGGRFALNFIQESARGGGYLACNRATVNTSLNLLNTSGSALAYDFRYGVGGYEATGTGPAGAFTIAAAPAADSSAGDWAPGLDTAFSAAVNKQVKGSDVLVIRSSVPRSAPAYTTADVIPGATVFQVSSGSTLLTGQLAVISDCTKSATFQISSATGGSPANISFGGSISPPGNVAGAALLVGFSSGAMVSPVTTSIYYIGVGADGDSALKRMEFVNGMVNGAAIFTDEELVPDIENMQLLYGIDTTGIQDASAYVTADLVPDFGSVVSIKVALLAASPPNLGAPPATALPAFILLGTQVTVPNDTRMRKVFDITIAVRSALN
jgi:type IV pilus assembly protein PilW